MINYSMDGRETIALRGYENQSLSSRDGSIIYNKFSIELRYPITLKPSEYNKPNDINHTW